MATSGMAPNMRKKFTEEVAEAEREALQKHLDEQEAKRRQNLLYKEARERKRLADKIDLTPQRREMYNDKVCADAAKIPGPGMYSPRLTARDGGKTFGASPFGSANSSAADRDAGSLDSYRVKVASQMPGPASYSPRGLAAGVGGTTFGLSAELRHGKVAPDAHDMSKMVAHLRDLPAPGAYSPRNPMEKNKGFRMVPSNARSMVEQTIANASKVPGPGTYELEGSLSSRSTIMGGGGSIKSDLDMVMSRASEIPGPGRYESASQLRSKGSPRFSKGGSLSFIESVQVDARVRPCRI